MTIVLGFATNADQDQPENPYSLIMMCTVYYSTILFLVNPTTDSQWYYTNWKMDKSILAI